jgi:hypothetical protein
MFDSDKRIKGGRTIAHKLHPHLKSGIVDDLKITN